MTAVAIMTSIFAIVGVVLALAGLFGKKVKFGDKFEFDVGASRGARLLAFLVGLALAGGAASFAYAELSNREDPAAAGPTTTLASTTPPASAAPSSAAPSSAAPSPANPESATPEPTAPEPANPVPIAPEKVREGRVDGLDLAPGLRNRGTRLLEPAVLGGLAAGVTIMYLTGLLVTT